MNDCLLFDLPRSAIGEVIRNEVELGGLIKFAEIFWPVVEPGIVHVAGWHEYAVASHLEAVSKREIRKLVINIPPGHSKSLFACVFWPCWHWANDPGHRWLFASHDGTLVYRDAEKSLMILRSEFFRLAFPDCQLAEENPAIGEYYTTARGLRFATTVRGRGVGWHGHTKVTDDPLKPLDVYSKTHAALERANNWHTGTFSSRNVDPKNVADVIIMQRIAQKDLSGLRLGDGYEHLCLPLEYIPKCSWDRGSKITRGEFEPEVLPDLVPRASDTPEEAAFRDRCAQGWFGFDPRTEPSEILHPERFDQPAVDELKKNMGAPSNVQAQAQQNPVADVGGFVERAWFKRYRPTALPAKVVFFQTWDLPDKGEKDSHSHISGTLWATDWVRLYLIAEVNGLMNWPTQRRTFAAMNGRKEVHGRWVKSDELARLHASWLRARIVEVEEKAGGVQLVAELRETFPGLTPVEPEGSKEDRMRVASDAVEAGLVYIPDEPWAEEWLDEVVGFPRAAKNDRADTFTMAERRFRSVSGRMTRALEALADEQDKRRAAERPRV